MSYESPVTEAVLPFGRKTPTEPCPPVLAASVRSTLDRILRSPEFRASKRNGAFLRRIVEAELAGRGHEINGYVIGSEVFGRGKSFDHMKDPIVRIEASKLRRDLERYYLTAGRGERIFISIPKGGYRPVFQTRDEVGGTEVSVPAGRLDAAAVTIASLRLGGAGADPNGPTLRAQLADGLTGLGEVSVFVAPEPEVALLDSETVRRVARANGTGFVLSGDMWSHDGQQRLVFRLHEGESGRLAWSGEFPHDRTFITAEQVRAVGEALRRLAAPTEQGTST